MQDYMITLQYAYPPRQAMRLLRVSNTRMEKLGDIGIALTLDVEEPAEDQWVICAVGEGGFHYHLGFTEERRPA